MSAVSGVEELDCRDDSGGSDNETAPCNPRCWVTKEQAAAISGVDHFRNSEYRSLDLNDVLDEYMSNFVEPLIRLTGQPNSVADIGAGYGWLAFAFALGTDAKITVMEYDPRRLAAARQIAAILGVEHRIEWIVGSVAAIPLPDRAIDAVYCVEVIEHTGVEQSYVDELCRISNDVLVITTPNKLFPVINHDTVLPFCHWLPLRVRDIYAAAFGRSKSQSNNLFWSPFTLFGGLRGFQRTSRFLQFGSYGEYKLAQTRLGPRRGIAAACLSTYFAGVARCGRFSVFFLPNLASTFRRR